MNSFSIITLHHKYIMYRSAGELDNIQFKRNRMRKGPNKANPYTNRRNFIQVQECWRGKEGGGVIICVHNLVSQRNRI